MDIVLRQSKNEGGVTTVGGADGLKSNYNDGVAAKVVPNDRSAAANDDGHKRW